MFRISRIVLVAVISAGSVFAEEPTKPAVMSARELAKVMDFTKLPVIKGTQLSDSGETANFQAKVPGTAIEVAKFYRKNLDELGWKPEKNSLSDTDTSATLWKDGHYVYLMAFASGQKDVFVVV